MCWTWLSPLQQTPRKRSVSCTFHTGCFGLLPYSRGICILFSVMLIWYQSSESCSNNSASDDFVEWNYPGKKLLKGSLHARVIVFFSNVRNFIFWQHETSELITRWHKLYSNSLFTPCKGTMCMVKIMFVNSVFFPLLITIYEGSVPATYLLEWRTLY